MCTDISNVMMCLTSIDSQLVQICITWCTSLDCVKYHAPQYNTSKGRWKNLSPWRCHLAARQIMWLPIGLGSYLCPRSLAITSDFTTRHSSQVSLSQMWKFDKIKKWFCCIPHNKKFTLIFAFYSLITPTMSKNISNLRVLCFNVCQFPM